MSNILEKYKSIIESYDLKISPVPDSNSLYDAVINVIDLLDNGIIRISEKTDNNWCVNEWIKKAILIYFKLARCTLIDGAFDKMPIKFNSWTENDFLEKEIRVVKGAITRKGVFLNKGVVLMNCLVNIGAYIDKNTMIDSFATVGSCAQIGKNCHISSGAVIGGVLEPISATPVIIEDDCFIGANASIVEGVIIRNGSKIAMGTRIGASTKIIYRETGEIITGVVPEKSIVVPGSYQSKNGLSISCAVILEKNDTNINLEINEILRQ